MSVSMLSQYLIHSAGIVLVKIFQGCCLIKGFSWYLIDLGQAGGIFFPLSCIISLGGVKNVAFF